MRDYNRAWDFFSGMSQAEIEGYLREDVTWHRPTWPLGTQHQHAAGWRWQDPYHLFLNGYGLNGTPGASEWDRVPGRQGKLERMLAVLDLAPGATACRAQGPLQAAGQAPSSGPERWRQKARKNG